MRGQKRLAWHEAEVLGPVAHSTVPDIFEYGPQLEAKWSVEGREANLDQLGGWRHDGYWLREDGPKLGSSRDKS